MKNSFLQPISKQYPSHQPIIEQAIPRNLLLIDPYPRNNPYYMTARERRSIWFPKLSLPVIAAYTPANWYIKLVDEAVQDIDFESPCDLFGISVMTCFAPGAYEIFAEFRKRGKTVILGGGHPPIVRKMPFGIAIALSVEKRKNGGLR